MRWFSGKRFSPIGIDIGTGAIKMAQLERIGERTRVAALAQHELPVAADSPEDRLEAVRSGLSNLIRRGIFQGSNVVLTLNAQQLFVQNIQLPRQAIDELEKVVRWEADERLPEGFGDAEVRHLMAGEIRTATGASEGAESRREVILLACRRQELNELIELLESLRLRLLAVDIPACALVRASQSVLRRKTDEQTGLLFLDVGAGMTTSVVTRGQEILLIKPLPMGGRSMDRLVARRLNLSVEDAALTRRQWTDGEIDGGEPELSRAVGEVVRSEIESLASELLMCVRYHNVTFRGNRITRTVLYGGEVSPRMAGLLAGGINLSCDLGDPFVGLELSASAAEQITQSRPGQWAVAIGLCSKPLGNAAYSPTLELA